MAPVTREALRSALMPTINSMSATGVVSLPGIMSGQILGQCPGEAVKYQILVTFLIAGGTGLGAVAAVLGARVPPHRWPSPPPPRSAASTEADIATHRSRSTRWNTTAGCGVPIT
jgi:hypothetical protein